MKKESRIYTYLLCLIFVAIILLASGPAAGGASASADGWLGIMPPSPELLERVERGEAELPQIITDPELRDRLGVNQPAEKIQPVGPWQAIALLVQFTDNPAATGATYFDTMLFSTGTGTLKDYYDEVSYGILDIVTVNLPSSMGWMTMPQTYAFYVAGNNGFGTYPQNAQKLAEDAVWAADPIVNYSNYDNDGDGFVESLFVIHAGPGAEYTGSANDIWSHKWAMVNDPVTDGVTLDTYTMEPEYWAAPGDMTVGVYAHELAHAFGLPDLYDTDGSSFGIGRWALMAGGSWNGSLGSSPAWFSAWSRAFLGFVTPTNVLSNSAAVSIPSAETSQTVYRLWTNGAVGAEYFLVENRQAVGYDAALPGFGTLIWHIDDSRTNNTQECNQLNNWICGPDHFLVALEQADGLFDLENSTSSGDTGDPYPGSTNNRDFDFSTLPNSSSYYHNSDTCVGVNNISNSAATMTADLNVSCGGAPPDINVIPSSLSVVVPLNGSTTEFLTIENLGGGPLTYSISDEQTGSPAPSVGDLPGIDDGLNKPSSDSMEAFPLPVPANGGEAAAVNPAPSIEARPGVNDGPDIPSSDTMEAFPLPAPANGGEAAAVVNPVLIIQDSLPWGHDAIQQELTANGIAYDQVDSSQIATINLAPYQMVVIPSVQGDPYVTAFNADIAKFEAYVNAGGNLWLSTATYGGIDLLTPGGVVSAYDGQDYNDIVAPAHPWVSGVPNPMYGNWASHNSFTNLYPGSTVVAQAQTSGNPTLVDYTFGAGRVLITGQTLEIAWGLGWDGAPIVENSLLDLFKTGSVLIIQDFLPWGFDAIQTTLTANGIAYTEVDSSQIATINLAPFQMVVIPSVQGDPYVTVFNANIAKFEAYVNAGGKLWLSTAIFPGELDLLTPGGVVSAPETQYYNDIIAPGHPWVSGVPNPMYGTLASHNSFTTLYPGSTVVAQAQTSGNPTLVDYDFGAGRVLITGQPLEFAWGIGQDGAPIVENSLLDMLGANPDALWLTESPTSGVVPAGGWQDIAVTFDAAGLSAGIYTGNILIASDDPDEPLVVVPVSMEVTDPSALLYIDPPFTVVPLGNTAVVDVVVDDSSSSTFAVELELHFDPAIVEVVSVLPGTCPSPDFIAQNTWDNVLGTINYAATSVAPSTPCGNGTVIQITFNGLVSGISPLDFASWLLSDINGLPIPATTQNGTLEVPITGTIAGLVDLQGRTDESGAEVCADDGINLVCMVTGPSGAYSLDVPAGNHDVTVDMARYLDAEKLNVPVVAGSTTNLLPVTCLGGDTNDDCVINILDLALEGGRFGTICGDPTWDERADINDDCTVNILDLAVTGGNFGETCPVPWS